MFRKEKYKAFAESALREIAQRHGIEIKELSVMPEHIHILANLPHTMPPSRALQLLKGALSFQLFRHEPKFRLRYKKGKFFSRGKLANSVGYATFDVIERYVRNQEKHHQISLHSF